jgi:hypothetical protein
MFSIAYNERPRGRWASGSERSITSDLQEVGAVGVMVFTLTRDPAM